MNISTGKMQCPQCYNIFTNSRALRCHMQHRQHSQSMRSTSVPSLRSATVPAESSHLLPDVNLSQGTEADLNEGTEADVNEDTEARYLHFQRTYIDKLREHARDKDMSKVKRKDGQFTTAKMRTYMMILVYVASRPQISEADATSLLHLVKDLSSEEGNEIGLPSRQV